MNSSELPSVIVATSNQTPTEIPPNNTFQKRTFLLIAIIILVLVIGVGSYLFVKSGFLSETSKIQTNLESIAPNAQLSPTLYVSSASSNQMQATPQTMNWKTLNSTSCYLTLKYPDNWKGKIQETKYGCSITIEHPIPESAFLILSKAQDTTWDKILSENKDAQKTTIAGGDGLRKTLVTDSTGSMYGFYFYKENSIYNGAYFVASAYPDIKNTFEEIINTIQLTGKQSDYQSIVNVGEDTLNTLNQAKDVGVKTDIDYLQSAIENYKVKYNTFPESFQILVDNQLIKKILVDPYTNLPYEYINYGQTYSISGKLHDGTIYKLP